ncbi:mitogen-activated protein kinase kinase kinase 9 [Mortierella sp. AD011]|nr:mitogen-activated protein kinase kinase kinase 9 [Mortierella sp. AD011]
MAEQSDLHPYGNYNGAESVNMDSLPSLSHSTLSSASDVMEFDSMPVEAHQAHIAAYGRHLEIDLQRQNVVVPQHQQQQQQQQQQQPLLQQQYQQQQQFQFSPQNFLDAEKQLGYQFLPQLQLQNLQTAWPRQANDQHAAAPLTENCVETNMPSLTEDHSTNSSEMLQSASSGQEPVFPHIVDHGAGVAVNGFEDDLEYFTTSILNMIPAGISDNATPMIDFTEFKDRRLIAKGGNGEIRQAFWESRNCRVEVLKICGNHDNIVQFYGISDRTQEDKIERFMVMQYYECGDLVKLLEGPRLTPEELTFDDRLSLALDIVMGLDHLLRCGFHHGDLHPKNILIESYSKTALSGHNRNGYRARLTDFGLRRIRDNTNEVSSQPLGGVWQFMAPERMYKDRQSRPRYNVRCDIFALGVIYWYLISGRYPFRDRTVYTPKIREKRVEGTEDWYYALYTQAWSEDPNDRQESLDEIIQVLRSRIPFSSTQIGHSQAQHAYATSPPTRQELYMPADGNRVHHGYSPGIDPSLSGGSNGVAPAMSAFQYAFNMPIATPPSAAVPKSSTRSTNPNHPRNKKQDVPNGMPGRTIRRS